MSSTHPNGDSSEWPASKKFSHIPELVLITAKCLDRGDLRTLKDLSLASRQMYEIASDRIDEIGGLTLRDFDLRTTNREVPKRYALPRVGVLPVTEGGQEPPFVFPRVREVVMGDLSEREKKNFFSRVDLTWQNPFPHLDVVRDAPLRDYNDNMSGPWYRTTLRLDRTGGPAIYSVPRPRTAAHLFDAQELHCPKPNAAAPEYRFVPTLPTDYDQERERDRVLRDPPRIQSVEPDDTDGNHYSDQELAVRLRHLHYAHLKAYGRSFGSVAAYMEDGDLTHSKAADLSRMLMTSRDGLGNLKILRRRGSVLPSDISCLESLDPESYGGVRNLTFDVSRSAGPLHSMGAFPPSLKKLTLSYHGDISDPHALVKTVKSWASKVDPKGQLSIEVQKRNAYIYNGETRISLVSDELEAARCERSVASRRTLKSSGTESRG